MRICTLLVFVAALFPAYHTANAVEYTLSADADSGYVVGSGVPVECHLCTKYALRAKFENGAYFELWSAIDGLKEVVEIDYTAGYVWRPAKQWSIDISLNWYDLPNIGFGDTRGDVLSPKLIVRRELGEHAYAFAGTEPMLVDGQGGNNGYLAYVGMGVSAKLGNFRIGVEGRGGYDTTYELDRMYGKFSIQPSYGVSKDATVRFAGVTAWTPENAKPEFVWNIIGVSYNF